MKIKDYSSKFLWFVLGGVFAGFLSFVSVSDAQQSKLVKLIMRFGEERVLEDGTKVGISKGDGDLIVVTLSRTTSNQSGYNIMEKELESERSSALQGSKSGFNINEKKEFDRTSNSSTKLKIGSYKITARQTFYISGSPFTETISFLIKIESVDSNGVVKGRIYTGGGEGRLKGQVDSNGRLFLEGNYVSLNVDHRIKLNATVDDDTLIDGSWTDSTNYGEPTKGTFNIGTLQ